MRVVNFTPETAAFLRDLSRRATEAYAMFEDAQQELRKLCTELAGPTEGDWIEIVSEAEYLSETNEGRWH
jgi:hypothetical protein